jgi:hypothetical protein
VAEFGRTRQRHLHQPAADARALRCWIDGERPQQQRWLAAGIDVPQADRADQLAALASDEGEAVGGQATTAEPLLWFQHAGTSHGVVEQGFPGGNVSNSFVGKVDHDQLRDPSSAPPLRERQSRYKRR